jgi:hypothetical protein
MAEKHELTMMEKTDYFPQPALYNGRSLIQPVSDGVARYD